MPWPKNGEIDIMDAFQRMVKASATRHTLQFEGMLSCTYMYMKHGDVFVSRLFDSPACC